MVLPTPESPLLGQDSRRLPLVLPPLGDECLQSWLLRLSADVDCPPGLLAQRLNLPRRPAWTGGVRVVCFGVVIPERHAAHVANVAGLTTAQVKAMHVQRYDGTAVDLATIDWTDERTMAATSRGQWFIPYSSRLCPACLKDRPGVWPVWWRLGHAAACPKHRTVLVDVCPDCSIPFGRGYRGHPRGLSVARVLDPNLCGNHTTHGPCDRVLASVEERPALDTVVEVQSMILTNLNGHGDPGRLVQIGGAPATVPDWFGVLHDLAAVLMATLIHSPVAASLTQELDVEDLLGALNQPGDASTLSALGTRYRSAPPSADAASAVFRILNPALQSTSETELRAALQPLATAYHETVRTRGHDPLRQRPLSGSLATALASADRPRTGRIVSAALAGAPVAAEGRWRRTLSETPRPGSATRIPQLMPPSLYEHTRLLLPGTAHLTGRRFAVLAAARLDGAPTWAASARALHLDEHTAVRVADVVGRRISDPDHFWQTIRSTTQALITEDVDYRHRERLLSDVTAIPPSTWADACNDHGITYTPQRGKHAAAWIWQSVVMGNPYESPAITSNWATPTTRQSKVEGYRRFIAAAPTELLDDLQRIGLQHVATSQAPSTVPSGSSLPHAPSIPFTPASSHTTTSTQGRAHVS